MTSRAASSSAFFCGPRVAASTVAGSSAPASWSGSRVEVIVGPTQPSTTDSRRPEIALFHRVSRNSFKNLFRAAIGASGCLRCGGLDRLDQRWASPRAGCGRNHARNRSQPTGGNPIASPPLALAGAVNPPPRPSEGTPLDSPGEGQTLGYRVADRRPTKVDGRLPAKAPDSPTAGRACRDLRSMRWRYFFSVAGDSTAPAGTKALASGRIPRISTIGTANPTRSEPAPTTPVITAPSSAPT